MKGNDCLVFSEVKSFIEFITWPLVVFPLYK